MYKRNYYIDNSIFIYLNRDFKNFKVNILLVFEPERRHAIYIWKMKIKGLNIN